ncbi:hypothetical protein NDU88_004947 [Pleurodeles waltl]|uniref:Uncharacterized protein n=1 Tax=Pleurodeles waltl TaxID=8319 RepID=A0AAV7WAL4_PLEWA|nr:hypothetical protein NDU88_004947 [Pleurodeles waltl]
MADAWIRGCGPGSYHLPVICPQQLTVQDQRDAGMLRGWKLEQGHLLRAGAGEDWTVLEAALATTLRRGHALLWGRVHRNPLTYVCPWAWRSAAYWCSQEGLVGAYSCAGDQVRELGPCEKPGKTGVWDPPGPIKWCGLLTVLQKPWGSLTTAQQQWRGPDSALILELPPSETLNEHAGCMYSRAMVLKHVRSPFDMVNLHQCERAVTWGDRVVETRGLRIIPDKSYAYSFWGTWSEPVIPFGPMTIATAPVSFWYLVIRIYRDQADLLDRNLNQAITTL